MWDSCNLWLCHVSWHQESESESKHRDSRQYFHVNWWSLNVTSLQRGCIICIGDWRKYRKPAKSTQCIYTLECHCTDLIYRIICWDPINSGKSARLGNLFLNSLDVKNWWTWHNPKHLSSSRIVTETLKGKAAFNLVVSGNSISHLMTYVFWTKYAQRWLDLYSD